MLRSPLRVIFIFVDSAGIGFESESNCSPFRADSDSGTSHSGPIPSPVKNGLESGIESDSGLGRYRLGWSITPMMFHHLHRKEGGCLMWEGVLSFIIVNGVSYEGFGWASPRPPHKNLAAILSKFFTLTDSESMVPLTEWNKGPIRV